MDGERTLAGRYRLEEMIGRGGMGTVYRATDLRLGRWVAVKLLSGPLVEEDPASVARFNREARSAARLTHSGVVKVYDAGSDDGTRFIVMEYVDGRSLEAVLRSDAPLLPARAARIARQVADALAAAHAAGVVHRDIKPANVMLTADDSVRVLDFGIARILGGTALTQTAAIVGTASCMSPEQASGERADERSDIYSLGCVLYALLCGRPPFTGETDAAILLAHLRNDPVPPSATGARIPAGLDALVMEMLAKDPLARPQTVAPARRRRLAAGTALAVGLTLAALIMLAAALDGPARGRAAARSHSSSTRHAASARSHAGVLATHTPTHTPSALTSTQPGGSTGVTVTDIGGSQPPGDGGIPPGHADQPPGQRDQGPPGHVSQHGDGGGGNDGGD